MQTGLLIWFILFSAVLANGQRRIGVVEADLIQSKLIAASQLDCLIVATKDSLQKRSLKWKVELAERMGVLINRFDGSPNDWKKIEDKFKLEMSDLERLDQIRNDSLLAWRKIVLADFDVLIQQKAKEVAQEKRLHLIIDAKSTLYFDGKLDVTKNVMDRVLQDKTNPLCMASKINAQADRAIESIIRPKEYFRYPGQ